jgi:hypothetical protein
MMGTSLLRKSRGRISSASAMAKYFSRTTVASAWFRFPALKARRSARRTTRTSAQRCAGGEGVHTGFARGITAVVEDVDQVRRIVLFHTALQAAFADVVAGGVEDRDSFLARGSERCGGANAGDVVAPGATVPPGETHDAQVVDAVQPGETDEAGVEEEHQAHRPVVAVVGEVEQARSEPEER